MNSLSNKITQQIQGMQEDTSFGYAQLVISGEQYQSAAKVLERLQKKGIIKKLSKGIFFKPKMTPFGEKTPGEEQVLKPYLYQDGKRTAYITGNYLYNQMGLTTQVPAIIQIASRNRRIFVNRGTIQATAVKSYVDVSDENYQLLGLLDVIKDLKQIPDMDIQSAITILKKRIGQLDNNQLMALIGYALKYPPRVRALLGALLTAMGKRIEARPLKDHLNPLTTFKLDIDDTLLPSALEWNIQ
jgi:hypothetical protein